MARPTHDIVATLGEYTAGDGTKKKRYHTCGKAFTNDSGQISLKLDALPCSPEWSGWLSLYPVREDAPAPRQDPRPAGGGGETTITNRYTNLARGMPVAPAAAAPDDDDDEIPF